MSQSLQEAVNIIEELARREHFKGLDRFEPYPKQLEWLVSDKPINTLWGGNQVGKSLCAAILVASHARGEYPSWYTGPRHKRAVDIWVVGLTNESTRDTCQRKLLGPDLDHPGFDGLLKPDWILGNPTRRSGVQGACDTLRIKHISGGTSTITFKSAEMGREKLQGATLDILWMDEEPDRDVFDELIMRLISRRGQMLLTFTPLKGMSDVCLFLIEDESGMVNRVTISWTDVKHLDEETMKMFRKMYSKNPSQFKARSTGEVTIASGLVYPFQEEIFIKRFPMEKFWPRMGAIDVGWDHPTASLVAALDSDSQCIYVYGEYKVPEKPPSTHCSALLKWGDIDYTMDPAALQSGKSDGEKILHQYLDEFHRGGPDWNYLPESEHRIFKADNAVLAGINDVYELFDQGKLFLMNDLFETRKEIKLYRWDENKPGRPVKKLDDLMDCLRYLIRNKKRFRIMGHKPNDMSRLEVEQWKPKTRGY